MHKDVELSWGEAQDKAFRKLKKLLRVSPILAYYDRNCELIIQCDASQFGIGAALMQNGKPLAYVNANVNAPEKWHQFT